MITCNIVTLINRNYHYGDIWMNYRKNFYIREMVNKMNKKYKYIKARAYMENINLWPFKGTQQAALVVINYGSK